MTYMVAQTPFHMHMIGYARSTQSRESAQLHLPFLCSPLLNMPTPHVPHPVLPKQNQVGITKQGQHSLPGTQNTDSSTKSKGICFSQLPKHKYLNKPSLWGMVRAPDKSLVVPSKGTQKDHQADKKDYLLHHQSASVSAGSQSHSSADFQPSQAPPG